MAGDDPCSNIGGSCRIGQRGPATFSAMRTHRTLPTIALLAAAMIGLTACAQLDEAVTGRDLECTGTPYDLCVRIADYVKRTLPREFSADNSEVTVEPRVCDADEAGDTGCWWVEAMAPDIQTGAMVHQHADGTLGSHYTSIGSPPDT